MVSFYEYWRLQGIPEVCYKILVFVIIRSWSLREVALSFKSPLIK